METDKKLGFKKLIMKKKLKTDESLGDMQHQSTVDMERSNESFIKILSEIEFIKMKQGDFMSAKRYKNAQEAIYNVKHDIFSPKDLEGVKFIGAKMLEVLTEYQNTGQVAYLEKEKKNPVNIFANIYGVGYVNAKKIVQSGITTISQLRQKPEILNDKQRIGLTYYEDILERIPRNEIDEYNKIFKFIFDSLKIPSCKYEIVGSYRRGVASSGDIDVIISDYNNISTVFKRFIEELEKQKIILHRLADGKSKVLAIGNLSNYKARRIDFLYSSPQEYPFAVLYFTGSKGFNTAMRQRALDLGYSLNEHGIYEMKNGIKQSKLNLIFENEKDIFDFLSMEYKNPQDRIDSRSIVLKESHAEVENEIKIKKGVVKSDAPRKRKIIMKRKRTLKKKPEMVTTYPRHVELFRKIGYDYLKSLEVNHLESIVNESNRLYHNTSQDNMLTDCEYDIIKEYLEKRDPRNPILKKVGATVKKDKVVLPFEMASMDKIKPDTKALDKWLSKYDNPESYVITSKLDGISGLYYNKKEPKLYTRGNGLVGQDVSHLLPYLKLPKREGLVVRGEFIISKGNFNKYFKNNSSNARNLVGGIINKKEPSMAEMRYLDFVAYEVIEPVMKPSEQLALLEMLQFNVVHHGVEPSLTNSILSKHLIDGREKYAYEMDGIVVYHDKVYERPKGNPEYAFAFKMVLSDQIAEAKVVDVIWTPSKDGYLKPRVRIEPIELNGVTIEYATGFNGSFVETHKIGIGSIIQIIRSGDVIPHIMKVILPAAFAKMPEEEYVWNNTHIDILLKDAETNPVVMEKKITLFFKHLEIVGVGEGIVRKLIQANYNTIPNILAMEKKEFLNLPGFKEKLAEKIYNNIQSKVKDTSLITFMSASNIFGRGIGEKKIAPILESYPDILLSDDSLQEKVVQVKSVKGIAEKTAVSFVNNIKSFVTFMDQANLTHKLTVLENNQVYDESHELYAKKLVLTEIKGKDLERFIKSVGGDLAKNVSKNTYLVIKKDEMTNTEKANAAQLLNIKTMTENEFRKKYNI